MVVEIVVRRIVEQSGFLLPFIVDVAEYDGDDVEVGKLGRAAAVVEIVQCVQTRNTHLHLLKRRDIVLCLYVLPSFAVFGHIRFHGLKVFIGQTLYLVFERRGGDGAGAGARAGLAYADDAVFDVGEATPNSSTVGQCYLGVYMLCALRYVEAGRGTPARHGGLCENGASRAPGASV